MLIMRMTQIRITSSVFHVMILARLVKVTAEISRSRTPSTDGSVISSYVLVAPWSSRTC